MSPDEFPEVQQDLQTDRCGLRIRFVTEINSNAPPTNQEIDTKNTSNSRQTATKRKLPSWMMTSSETCVDDPSKKHKSQNLEDIENNNSKIECSSSVTLERNNEQVNSSQVLNINNELAVASTSNETNNNASLVSEKEILTNEVGSNTDLNLFASASSSNNVTTNTTPEAKSSEFILPKIKKETEEADSSYQCENTDNSIDIKPLLKIKKEEATSTTRESCKYGIRCYRKNPQHRVSEAHPGDPDYRRPVYPTPPSGTPSCPFGNLCYRRNPIHFQEFSHPPEN